MQLSPISLSLTRLGGSWDESALWPLGASSPGLWIDPSYSASQWQNSAGTTALSTVGTVLDSSNPVGLILDRKGGLALGPELVTNGDFSNGSTGWTINPNASFSVVSGTAELTAVTGSSAFQIFQTITTVVGKTYRVTGLAKAGASNAVAKSARFQMGGFPAYPVAVNGVWQTITFCFVATATSHLIVCDVASDAAWGAIGDKAYFDDLSVREIPGLHLSQSGSTQRPVASGRVNLLLYSDALDTANWNKTACTVATDLVTPPSAAPAAVVFKVAEDASNGQHYIGPATTLNSVLGDNLPVVCQAYIKAAEYSTASFSMRRKDFSFLSADFDLVAMTATSDASSTATITDAGGGWRLCRAITNSKAGAGYVLPAIAPKTINFVQGVPGSGVLVCGFQVATFASNYQRVGAASDYTATGFPQYLKFDGVDDALSSATFSAGTLTSSMDCLIAVRRDSAAMAIVGPYQAAGDATKFIGVAESGSPYLCVGIGAGAPTVFVDGAQLTGGTAVTFGTLHTALTPGAWHIVEFRGLNLSTWTALALGAYGSGYNLNGALGKTYLFASGQDANRDKARARMAAYFGVTLP